MKKFILILTGLVFLITTNNVSQVFDPIKWTFKSKEINNKKVDLIFEATIDSGWHLYGLNIPENGPIATSIIFTDTTGYELKGKTVSVTNPEIKYDPIFGIDLELFSGKATFKQQIVKTTKERDVIA